MYLNTIITIYHLLIILAITISTNKKEIIFEDENIKTIPVNKVNYYYVLLCPKIFILTIIFNLIY